MKKIFMILLVALLALASCSSDKENVKEYTDDELLLLGEDYLDALLAGKYEEAYNDFGHDKDMKEAVSPEGYKEIFDQLKMQSGNLIEKKGSSLEVKGDFRIASYGLIFENQSLNMNVVFNKEGQISGLNFTQYTFGPAEELSENEIEIEFGVEGYKLKGILTLPPDKEGPHPCVILVHGSGPNDLDETIGPNKPFKDIAEGLSKKGVAVFRYNKRTFTHGQKMMEEGIITPYEETVEDVVEAFEMISNRDDVDSNNVYVLGHSMGGNLIPKINEYLDNSAGYVIMAGSVSYLEDLMVDQIEYLANLDGNVTEEEEKYISETKAAVEKIKNLDELDPGEMILNAHKEYWQYFHDYNIEESVKNINVPTLVLQGERDYQVTMDEFNKWKNMAENLGNFNFISYEKLNHLMMPGEGKPNSEEYMVKNKVSEEVINDIYEFIMEE